MTAVAIATHRRQSLKAIPAQRAALAMTAQGPVLIADPAALIVQAAALIVLIAQAMIADPAAAQAMIVDPAALALTVVAVQAGKYHLFLGNGIAEIG